MTVDLLHNQSVSYSLAEMKAVQAMIQEQYNRATAAHDGKQGVFLLDLAQKLNLRLVSVAEQEVLLSK